MWRPQKPKVFKSKTGTAKIKRDSYSSGTTGWWAASAEVRKRSGGKCEAMLGSRRCLKPAKDVHHIIPLSRGGTTTKSNMIHICADCHSARHSHMR